MSKSRQEPSRLADMSLPPALRGRRGRRNVKRVGGTPPAQLGHATGARAARRRRDGERAMERERRGARR
jgi:hypothetical protein